MSTSGSTRHSRCFVSIEIEAGVDLDQAPVSVFSAFVRSFVWCFTFWLTARWTVGTFITVSSPTALERFNFNRCDKKKRVLQLSLREMCTQFIEL